MHLRSLTLRGFKSFPERTQLDFGPGVSVVVGPNGSGKSNITDAVLWAMGEQSPLAVRGSSMQDVIFGGAPGVQARNAAEVEIVLENSGDGVDLPLSEISIVRRLERSGEGSYRLNGARCRLSDVVEALSDTGLGKETHSVISQGRVEEIVTSRPHDRRLLIEEAAGLGKHRKRRRRARLKLERTQQNLDRALDVEREARSRLRPLKRQAEAAQLHERLELQTLEARLELARDQLAGLCEQLDSAEAAASGARQQRAQAQQRLRAVSERRGAAERALAGRARHHDELAERLLAARSAHERLALRGEQALSAAGALRWRIEHADQQLQSPHAPGGREAIAGRDRASSLQAELEEVRRRGARELDEQLADLRHALEREQAHAQALEHDLAHARQERARAEQLVREARQGSVWSVTWQEVRRVIAEGIERALGAPDEQARAQAVGEAAEQAEQVARGVVEYALKGVQAAEEARERAEQALREAERRSAQAAEAQQRTRWLVEQRTAAAEQGPLALRRAQLEGELAAERRAMERARRARDQAAERARAMRERRARDRALLGAAERLAKAVQGAVEMGARRVGDLQAELERHSAAAEQMTEELRACATQEAEIQGVLAAAAERVTEVEVAAQRVRDQVGEARQELERIAARLGAAAEGAPDGAPGQARAQRLEEQRRAELAGRVERLRRRREQLGPVNPLAQEEYAQAVAHVEEMEARRQDLETAMRELRGVIAEADREIQRSFQETFDAAAENFSRLAAELFPGGSGRLRLVSEAQAPRPVLGGQQLAQVQDGARPEHDSDDEQAVDEERTEEEFDLQGVEIEITPAGKSTKRLSLLSGGEKSMTALAFLFAIFLARPCPFYILDEVEAALDDLNLDRFLALLRRYSDRAQFIVITHQKRTMEAADWLYGVSMAGDGVSKVLSQRLPQPSLESGSQAGQARAGMALLA